VTYHPPALLPLRREEVVAGALDAAELFAAPVVGPTLTVWIEVVQDAHGRSSRRRLWLVRSAPHATVSLV
jgi:hypothetical protein